MKTLTRKPWTNTADRPSNTRKGKEIIKETIICHDLKVEADSLVAFDSLVGTKDDSFFHYFIDYKSGEFKIQYTHLKGGIEKKYHLKS